MINGDVKLRKSIREVQEDIPVCFDSDPLLVMTYYDKLIFEHRLYKNNYQMLRFTNLDTDPVAADLRPFVKEMREYYSYMFSMKKLSGVDLSPWEKAVAEVLNSSISGQLKPSLFPCAISLQSFYKEQLKFNKLAEGVKNHKHPDIKSGDKIFGQGHRGYTFTFTKTANLRVISYDKARPGGQHYKQSFIVFKDDQNRLYDMAVPRSNSTEHYVELLGDDYHKLRVYGRLKEHYVCGYNWMIIRELLPRV